MAAPLRRLGRVGKSLSRGGPPHAQLRFGALLADRTPTKGRNSPSVDQLFRPATVLLPHHEQGPGELGTLVTGPVHPTADASNCSGSPGDQMAIRTCRRVPARLAATPPSPPL